jgi:hypothetical protein
LNEFSSKTVFVPFFFRLVHQSFRSHHQAIVGLGVHDHLTTKFLKPTLVCSTEGSINLLQTVAMLGTYMQAEKEKQER